MPALRPLITHSLPSRTVVVRTPWPGTVGVKVGAAFRLAEGHRSQRRSFLGEERRDEPLDLLGRSHLVYRCEGDERACHRDHEVRTHRGPFLDEDSCVDAAGCRTAKGNRDQTLQKARRDGLFEGGAQQQRPGPRVWFGIHRGGQIHQMLVGELPCGGFQPLLFGGNGLAS